MNTGNVKRSIAIVDGGEDIFSDDIKTTALIEEIEAAEIAARQAQIEKQIETSQPTAWQKFSERAGEKFAAVKTGVEEKIADLTTKMPEDPRAKKVSLGERVGEATAKIGARVRGIGAKTKPSRKSKMQVVKIEKKAEKVSKVRKQSSMRELFAKEVEGKRVAEYAVVAALVATAGVIWAWNLSHPLFQSQSTETVENVPITGGASPSEAEEDDDSPILTEQGSTSAESETIAGDDDGSTESYYSTDYRTGAASSANSGASGSNSANSYKGSATAQSTNRSASRTGGANSSANANQGGETVDNSWGDGSDIEWPQEDQGDEGEDVSADDGGEE